MEKTKGFIKFFDRPTCGDCKFMKWVGSGSRTQQTLYCTKIKPNFTIFLEDSCDEHEPE